MNTYSNSELISFRVERTTAGFAQSPDIVRDHRNLTYQQLEAPTTHDNVIVLSELPSEENIQADPVWRLRGMLERLNEMERLGRNWDSYASDPPSVAAVTRARALIWDIVGQGFGSAGARSIPFSIVPVSGAGLQVEWRAGGDSIEVEIGSDGSLGFLHSRGHGPNREFEEADDVSEHELVRRTLAAIS